MKIKDINIQKYLKNLIIVFLFIFSLEITFKLISGISLVSFSVIRILIISLIISSIMSFIYIFCSDKITKIINSIFSFLVSFYAFFQVGANNYIGTYMSINAGSQLGKVNNYITEFFGSYIFLFYLMFIPFILLVLYYIFLDKKIKIKSKDNKKYSIIFFIIVLCVSSILFYLSVSVKCLQNKYQIISNKELLNNPSNQSIAVNEFGVLTYGILDVKSFIFKNEEVLELPIKEKPVVGNNVDNRVIDDTAWKKLIDIEKDESLNSLNKYYISRNITSKNKYTSKLKDKNLIVILMESVNDTIKLYPEYFPNFNKIYSQGLRFNNNYSPRNSCSTGNNEMAVMTSIYTINNTCTANTYENNTYPESIFNVFKKEGYTTSSYHPYPDFYYMRNKIHKNMGSDKYYDSSLLGIDVLPLTEDAPSDLELMKKAVPEFIDQDKFVAFITSISAHRPYTEMNVGKEYYDLFKNFKVNSSMKNYLAKLKVTDESLGYLLSSLEEKNKLDDTVIVLFGDHYPYGLNDETVGSVLNYDIEEDYEKDRTPLIFYNSVINEDIQEYTTLMDILPTIFNLFGVEYDPRLYLGEDVLGESNSGNAIFSNGSWKNEHAYYNAASSTIKYKDDTRYTEKDIKYINSIINSKVRNSNLSIKKDYFSYLNSHIN